MSDRYACCVGDKTTTGGEILGLPEMQSTINGMRVALDGDPVTCPACGTTGAIVCIPPHQNVDFFGKLQALSGDLVKCACAVSPRLIHSQELCVHSFESDERPPASATRPNDQRSGRTVQGYQRWFCITDAETGLPLANTLCVVSIGGQSAELTTDSDGYIQVLADGPHAINVHATFTAPARALRHSGELPA